MRGSNISSERFLRRNPTSDIPAIFEDFSGFEIGQADDLRHVEGAMSFPQTAEGMKHQPSRPALHTQRHNIALGNAASGSINDPCAPRLPYAAANSSATSLHGHPADNPSNRDSSNGRRRDHLDGAFDTSKPGDSTVFRLKERRIGFMTTQPLDESQKVHVRSPKSHRNGQLTQTFEKGEHHHHSKLTEAAMPDNFPPQDANAVRPLSAQDVAEKLKMLSPATWEPHSVFPDSVKHYSGGEHPVHIDIHLPTHSDKWRWEAWTIIHYRDSAPHPTCIIARRSAYADSAEEAASAGLDAAVFSRTTIDGTEWVAHRTRNGWGDDAYIAHLGGGITGTVQNRGHEWEWVIQLPTALVVIAEALSFVSESRWPGGCAANFEDAARAAKDSIGVIAAATRAFADLLTGTQTEG